AGDELILLHAAVGQWKLGHQQRLEHAVLGDRICQLTQRGGIEILPRLTWVRSDLAGSHVEQAGSRLAWTALGLRNQGAQPASQSAAEGGHQAAPASSVERRNASSARA